MGIASAMTSANDQRTNVSLKRNDDERRRKISSRTMGWRRRCRGDGEMEEVEATRNRRYGVHLGEIRRTL